MLRTDAPYLGDFDENKKKFEATFKEPRMDTYADLVFFRLARHRRRIREQGAARTPCGNLPRVR